jgi:hypothetical protein
MRAHSSVVSYKPIDCWMDGTVPNSYLQSQRKNKLREMEAR